ncbi:MAG: cytochrome-c peroxidase [Acidobacteria bacterium]|nr:cytochrome-c peroxidase [Acidobacteriota bacterium]
MRFTVLAVLLFALPAERSGVPLGLDAYRPVPETNPLTPEKIALGRQLFFDRRLSRDRTIACASCHEPQLAFTDGRPVAVGIEGRTGARNVPTLINRVYGKSHFLDGRAPSLERQALEPIQNPSEMNMTLVDLLTRLDGDPDYATGFRSVFGRGPNAEGVAFAIAS